MRCTDCGTSYHSSTHYCTKYDRWVRDDEFANVPQDTVASTDTTSFTLSFFAVAGTDCAKPETK